MVCDNLQNEKLFCRLSSRNDRKVRTLSLDENAGTGAETPSCNQIGIPVW